MGWKAPSFENALSVTSRRLALPLWGLECAVQTVLRITTAEVVLARARPGPLTRRLLEAFRADAPRPCA